MIGIALTELGETATLDLVVRIIGLLSVCINLFIMSALLSALSKLNKIYEKKKDEITQEKVKEAEQQMKGVLVLNLEPQKKEVAPPVQ